MTKDFIKRVIKEVEELEKLVKKHKGTLNELLNEIEKMEDTSIIRNFVDMEKLFDFNYKDITTTIYEEDGSFKLSKEFDIWKDEECGWYGSYTLQKLKNELKYDLD